MCLIIESTEMPKGVSGVDYCIDCHVPQVDEQGRCQSCADFMRDEIVDDKGNKLNHIKAVIGSEVPVAYGRYGTIHLVWVSRYDSEKDEVLFSWTRAQTTVKIPLSIVKHIDGIDYPISNGELL